MSIKKFVVTVTDERKASIGKKLRSKGIECIYAEPDPLDIMGKFLTEGAAAVVIEDGMFDYSKIIEAFSKNFKGAVVYILRDLCFLSSYTGTGYLRTLLIGFCRDDDLRNEFER